MKIIKSSKSREKILSKIRTALRGKALPEPFEGLEQTSSDDIFSKSELSDEERFASAFINLGGRFVYCYNETDLAENIFALFENSGWKEMLCADRSLMELFGRHRVPGIKAMDKGSAEADACITTCEAVVGRTGTILFSSGQFMGRTSPIYYPVHIIVAYANQVAKDVNDALETLKEKYGATLPSMFTFTTGPSRTADVEKTLVVGVHGPAELYCFYVDA